MSTLIVAEIGTNHEGSQARAHQMIELAAAAGANAVKFQMFSVDRFIVAREKVEALRKFELPAAWLDGLRSTCDALRVQFMCTAFDLESLELIDPYVATHKIGSYEAAVPAFVEAVVAKGKPTLISDGVRAEPWLLEGVTRLRCVSRYPARLEDYHLRLHPPAPWGVSDHTMEPAAVPAAAVALGAIVVEKHMRRWLSASAVWPSTPDWLTAIDEREFATMVQAVRRTERACG